MCNIIGQKGKGNATSKCRGSFQLSVSYSLSDLVSSISEDGRKYMHNYAQTHPTAFCDLLASKSKRSPTFILSYFNAGNESNGKFSHRILSQHQILCAIP